METIQKIKEGIKKKAKKFGNRLENYLMKRPKNSARMSDEDSDSDLDLASRLHLSPGPNKRSTINAVPSSPRENVERGRGTIPKMKSGLRPRSMQLIEPRAMPKSKAKTHSIIRDSDQLAGPMTHKRPLILTATPRRSLRQLQIQDVKSPFVSIKKSPSAKPRSTYTFGRFDYLRPDKWLSNSFINDENRVRQRSGAKDVIDLDADESDSMEVVESSPSPPKKSRNLKKSMEIDLDSPIFNKPIKSKTRKNYHEINLEEYELIDSDEAIYDKPRSSKINNKNLEKKGIVKKREEDWEKSSDIKWLKVEKINSGNSNNAPKFQNEENNNLVLPRIRVNAEKNNSGIKIEKEKKFSAINFDVKNYLRRSNDPFHCFMDTKRCCEYSRTSLKFLHNYFNRIRDDTITHVYRDSGYNMSIAADKLRKMKSNIQYNIIRKFKEVEPDNLEQFQEMEFIRNLKRFRDFQTKEPEAKKIHLITL